MVYIMWGLLIFRVLGGVYGGYWGILGWVVLESLESLIFGSSQKLVSLRFFGSLGFYSWVGFLVLLIDKGAYLPSGDNYFLLWNKGGNESHSGYPTTYSYKCSS